VVVLTLKPLAVRVPAELEKEILEITKKEKTDKATVVKNLFETGITEWRKQTALELLQKGKITFAKAADVAKLSLWEFVDLANQHNIEWVRYTPEDVTKDFNNASAVNHK
jgi:predicted HTH domain antitoxin